MIPGNFLRQDVLHEPYIGSTSAGPRWGAPVPLRAHFGGSRRKVTAPDGTEVVSEGRLLLKPGVADPQPQDRFTVSGRRYMVIEAKPVSGPGGRAHHVEVALK